jgi:hypothetical protein
MKRAKNLISNKRITYLLLTSILIVGCSEIFEEDITKLKIELISPGDNVVTRDYTQNFRWRPSSAIEQYRLEIAKPDFSQSQTFLYDTLINATSFVTNLNPGTYQWRVRGENSGYSTEYTTRTLIVDTATDLSGTQLRLVSPQDSLQVNVNGIFFRWDPIFAAEYYVFQISSSGYFFDTIIRSNQLLKQVPTDKWLLWEVRAAKNGTFTPFTSRHVLIDQIPPITPTLLSPFDGFTTTIDTVSFDWVSISDATIYELTMYNSLGTSVISGYPLLLSIDSLRIAVPNGLVFWDVCAIDKAGNRGPKSTRRQFTNN